MGCVCRLEALEPDWESVEVRECHLAIEERGRRRKREGVRVSES